VTVAWTLAVERSRDELRAARTLLEAGLPAQAVSRAYFAAYHAAGAALGVLGETPSSPVNTVATFNRRVGEGLEDGGAARSLRKLFEDRNDVDYALAAAAPEEAQSAIAAAERFVDFTVRWVEERIKAA
jgi:uncharacterized protein (UPF0332 family)